jgi:hypothetical protein
LQDGDQGFTELSFADDRVNQFFRAVFFCLQRLVGSAVVGQFLGVIDELLGELFKAGEEILAADFRLRYRIRRAQSAHF